MGAIGGIVVAVFGVIWTIGAASMGAPPFFVLFGILFIIMAIAGVAYNAYNATQKNRMSDFDITTEREETDPIAQALGHASRTSSPDRSHSGSPRKIEGGFCPYCGAKVSPDFDYCPQCCKDI